MNCFATSPSSMIVCSGCLVVYQANLVQVDRLSASATACDEEVCHRQALLFHRSSDKAMVESVD
jgi:hypothetical protein